MKNNFNNKFIIWPILIATIVLAYGSRVGFVLAADPSPSPSSSPSAQQAKDQAKYQEEKQALENARKTEVTNAQTDCNNALKQYNLGQESTPAGSGGQFVPVHEEGQLLQMAISTNQHVIAIDTNTGQNTQLSILLCEYLREIRRTTYALENKAFITDPQLAREAATDVEKYKQSLSNLVNTGYTASGGQKPAGQQPNNPNGGSNPNGTGSSNNPGGSKLYVTNARVQENQVAQEATKVFEAGVNKSNSPFKNTIVSSLESGSVPESITNSALSEDQYNSVLNNNTDPQDIGGPDYWTKFESLWDINGSNNPLFAVLNAHEAANKMVQDAVTQSNNEIIAGQGYLPVRHCADDQHWITDNLTGNRYCTLWITDTPAINVSRSVSDALAARQNEYTNPNPGQVGPNNAPAAEDISSMLTGGNQQTGGGAASGIGTSNIINNSSLASDETGANTGGTGGTGDTGNNDGTQDDINYQGNGNTASPGTGGGGGTSPTSTPRPSPTPSARININATRGANGVASISWQVNNAASTNACTVNNIYGGWLGSYNDAKHEVRTLKNNGDALSTQDVITLRLPLAFSVTVSKNGHDHTAQEIKYATSSNGISMVAIWTPGSSVDKHDSYSLKITDGNFPHGHEVLVDGNQLSINPENVGGVISRMDAQLQSDPEMWYYRRSINANGKLNIYVDSDTIYNGSLIYDMQCRGIDGKLKNGEARLPNPNGN